MELVRIHTGKVKKVSSCDTPYKKRVYFEDGTNHLMSEGKDCKVGDIIGIDPWGSLWIKQVRGS